MSRGTSILIMVAGIALSIAISLATNSFVFLFVLPLVFWGGSNLGRRG